MSRTDLTESRSVYLSVLVSWSSCSLAASITAAFPTELFSVVAVEMKRKCLVRATLRNKQNAICTVLIRCVIADEMVAFRKKNFKHIFVSKKSWYKIKTIREIALY